MKSSPSVSAVLNRLLELHYRSAARYLLGAAPYREPGDEPLWQCILQQADDHEAMCARIVEMIQDRGGRVDYGDYPIRFTAAHDLSLKYLARRLAEHQRGFIAELQQCCQQLAHAPQAQGLAEECLGMAEGHLESLEEALAAGTAPPTLKLHEASAE